MAQPLQGPPNQLTNTNVNQAYRASKLQVLADISFPCYVVIATKPVHRLLIRSSAQLEGTPYHSSKLHPGPCSSAGCGEGQTDTQTAVVNIHFASATPHAQCNRIKTSEYWRPSVFPVPQNVTSPMVHQSVDEAGANSSSEQQSDVDFLRPLQRVTSRDDVIYADGDRSWLHLVHGAILTKPTPTSSSRRRPRRWSPSPLRSDENAASRPARRTLFGRPLTTSTPLRDVGNCTAARPSGPYGRCASDTAAVNCRRPPRPTPLNKSQSASTAVLTKVADDDDQRLVGDFTRPICLPVVGDTKHCDLNAISHHTVPTWTHLLSLLRPMRVRKLWSACVFVCSLAYLKSHFSKLHEIFFKCYPWPWLGLPLTTQPHVMYFRFCWRRRCHVFTNSRNVQIQTGLECAR